MNVAILVAALLGLHPGATDTDVARHRAVADGIAVAASRAPLRVGATSTAWLLIALAEHEGHLREDVRRCVVTGDQGRAITLFQLWPAALGDFTREQACSDDRIAARLALATLHAGEKVCHGSLRCAVRLYASGRNKDTRAAREILALWRTLQRR